MGLEVLGTLRFDEKMFKSCLEGVRIEAKEGYEDVETVLKRASLM